MAVILDEPWAGWSATDFARFEELWDDSIRIVHWRLIGEVYRFRTVNLATLQRYSFPAYKGCASKADGSTMIHQALVYAESTTFSRDPSIFSGLAGDEKRFWKQEWYREAYRIHLWGLGPEDQDMIRRIQVRPFSCSASESCGY